MILPNALENAASEYEECINILIRLLGQQSMVFGIVPTPVVCRP